MLISEHSHAHTHILSLLKGSFPENCSQGHSTCIQLRGEEIPQAKAAALQKQVQIRLHSAASSPPTEDPAPSPSQLQCVRGARTFY